MAIGKRKRFEVFKRDAFTCQYCGRQPPAVVLQVDHLIPASRGGSDDIGNLVAACFDCNSGKSDRLVTELPKAIEVNLELRKEAAAQLAAYNKFLEKLRQTVDQQVDKISQYWCESIGGPGYHVAATRRKSLRTFLKFLPMLEVIECVDIALSRKSASIENDVDAWQYFCGVCWRSIKKDGGR